MNKSLLLFCLIFTIGFSFGQEYDTIVYSKDEVKKMAVFPGCEEFKRNKSKLNDCLIEKLSEKIFDVLNYRYDGYYLPDMVTENSESFRTIEKVKTELTFQINQRGIIIQAQTITNENSEFDRVAKTSLDRVASRMHTQANLIEPAKDKKGNPVNIQLSLVLNAVIVEQID